MMTTHLNCHLPFIINASFYKCHLIQKIIVSDGFITKGVIHYVRNSVSWGFFYTNRIINATMYINLIINMFLKNK